MLDENLRVFMETAGMFGLDVSVSHETVPNEWGIAVKQTITIVAPRGGPPRLQEPPLPEPKRRGLLGWGR